MAIMTSNLSFVRAIETGFLSSARPSTDAVAALLDWQDLHSDREFYVIADEDTFLHAVLHYEEMDIEAGPQLQAFCVKRGVTYYIFPKLNSRSGIVFA